ncbi:MAG: PAS domain-containing sensor histidine kinase [Lentisphaeraceae bacterium]|nr:PAS domain-containing sensor histidine kinase [Lentisphaeraceae bacterium]
MLYTFHTLIIAFSLNPFSTEGFPERWHCGDWPEWLGWTHIISDLVIFLSYQLIPIFAVVFISKKKNISFPPLFWLLGLFVCFCGFVHLIEAIIFWYPVYPLAGIVKAMTALVSAVAAFYCFRLMPKAIELPTIAESEERHRVLFNAIPLCVLEVDFEGQILMLNKETINTFEYEESELLGKNVDLLIPERFKKSHQTHFDLYCKNPVELKLQNRELLAVTKRGKEFFVEIAITPTGEKKSLICSIIDIDQKTRSQLKLEEKNQEISQMFSFGLIGYIKSTLDGEVLEADDYYLNLIGYTREELDSGQVKWDAITPENILKKEQELLKNILVEKKKGPYEKQYIHKSGRKIDVLIGVSLIDENQGICSCYVLDITQLKDKERELQKTGKKLQKALDEQLIHKSQIEKYLEDLKVINKELDDFVYTASHDLKEPLRAIGGLSSLILHQVEKGNNVENVLETLEDIVKLSKRSRDQIDSLLRYATLGTNELNISTFNTTGLLNELLESFKYQINQKNAEVILGKVHEYISGDRSMVAKIFENLLSNALKYTNNNPVIKIGSEVVEGVNYFYVEDNGEGINEKDKEFIFKIFKTLHPEQGNTGAGLAIVKKIINRHKGSIRVESEIGKGTKMLFSLGEER